MFSKLSVLALVAPLVAGLTLRIPENPTSGGSITLVWDSAPGDPATFTIELTNEIFHNSYAIATNVVPEQGQVTIVLPIVPPGGGYTLSAVDIGNINNVYASSGQFNVGDTGATSVSSTTGTATKPVTTHSSSTTPVTTRSPTSTPGFGTTIKPSTTPTTSASSQTTANAPANSSSAASVPMKMNSNVGAIAAVVFSAVAGAAIIAF